MTALLSHTKARSSYKLTLGPLTTVVAHTDRSRSFEIRWQCTQLEMSRAEAVRLREELGAALDSQRPQRLGITHAGTALRASVDSVIDTITDLEHDQHK